MANEVDILENKLLAEHPEVFRRLLLDHTTHENIFWATDSYADLGEGYQWHDAITMECITGEHGSVLQPRAVKSREEQTRRSKDMAEVFTPSWVCNAQNNLVDEAWFDCKDVFNHENDDHSWTPVAEKITFPEGKTWQQYVAEPVMEVTCGEAPYLVSRYDTVTGAIIPLGSRIGLLDRKLRIVGENTETPADWLAHAKRAYQATYGFEWQGDSLLLAREALFMTFIEYYQAKFHSLPHERSMDSMAYIISWNLWQMDGLKGVVPGSCINGMKVTTYDLFGATEHVEYCPGCQKDDIRKHNGQYCLIRDWGHKDPKTGESNRKIRFIDLMQNIK